MSSLPTSALPAAKFLVRRMYRSIDLASQARLSAVAETENPGEDNWFWTDDNAKVLELLSRPEVWRRFPDETNQILGFIRSMCRGPFIFRRISTPRLDIERQQGSITSYRHSLMGIKFDTSCGAITLGVRFHDERNAQDLSLSGNYVEFNYRRRRFKVLVERFVSDIDVQQDGYNLALRQTAELYFVPFWHQRRLGQIIYTYTINASSMLIAVEATLDLDPTIRVSDVVLTIGHSSLRDHDFRNIVTDTVNPFLTWATSKHTAHDGLEASYYAIRQGHISGDSVALHSIPQEPARLSGFEATRGSAGRLHRAIARYAFPGAQCGSRLVAAEHKLLTSGGFYDRLDDYARFIRESVGAKSDQRAAYDFSISYDYGVVINAFAKCFASCILGDAPPPGTDRDELRSLVDMHLRFYFDLYVDRHPQQPNAIFSRELAFVILAVATMYRATQAEDYLHRLRRLCDVLLELELRFDAIADHPASGFLMRMDSPRVAFVDCHSAALLALTIAAHHLDDPRLASAIDRGLVSYCVETCRLEGGIVDTVAALMVDGNGVRRTENGFWNFKVGLTLRFFAALRNAVEPRLKAVAARHRERMELLEMIMRRQLERSVTQSDDGVEIRCSPFSGETNSESQPWVVLGLLGHPYD